jgi:serine protease AprX
MASRRTTLSLVLALVLALLAGAAWSVSPANASAVSQKVDYRVMEDTANGQSGHFLVVLTEQADLSRAPSLATKLEKGQFVTETLRDTAARTQPAVTSQLDALGLSYRPYWIANLIAVEGDRAAVEAIAGNVAVARIEPNRAFRGLPDPISEPEVVRDPNSPEWGLVRINADDVWALGYDGTGVTIANQDTGLDWDHPAIIDHYRGWNGSSADHNYHWWDAIHEEITIPNTGTNPCGLNLQAPCDDNNHGTHTVGTNVGDDGGANQIGVAPGAKVISCRNMESGNGRPNTYIECFQFFAAPTDLAGQNPNPALAPSVISNSWGCPLGAAPGGEECVTDSFLTVIQNLRDAGIMTVVSNGNSGSACNTTLAPPSYLDAATSVGSTTAADGVSGFSSRGPVLADGSNRIKPDIAAPGSSVRSSIPGGGYASFSGTSMAAPHVAGAVALLIDAHPFLDGNVDAIEAALFGNTFQLVQGQTCGGIPGSQFPNNTVGHGLLDVLAAVQNTTTPTAVSLSTLTTSGTNGTVVALIAGIAALGVAGMVVVAFRRK